MVGVSAQQPGASVNSVTYNGASPPKLGNISSSNQSRIEIWYLKAPAVGTYNVVVNNSQSDNGVVGIMSFSGVDQTTPFGTLATATGSGTSASVTVASASNELVYSVVAFNNASSNQTPGSGTNRILGPNSEQFHRRGGRYKSGCRVRRNVVDIHLGEWTIGGVSSASRCQSDNGRADCDRRQRTLQGKRHLQLRSLQPSLYRQCRQQPRPPKIQPIEHSGRLYHNLCDALAH